MESGQDAALSSQQDGQWAEWERRMTQSKTRGMEDRWENMGMSETEDRAAKGHREGEGTLALRG